MSRRSTPPPPNIPPEAMRMHVCWGNYEGPHDSRHPAREDHRHRPRGAAGDDPVRGRQSAPRARMDRVARRRHARRQGARAGPDRHLLQLCRASRADRAADRALRRDRRRGPRRRQHRLRLRHLRRLRQDRPRGGVEEARGAARRRRHRRRGGSPDGRQRRRPARSSRPPARSTSSSTSSRTTGRWWRRRSPSRSASRCRACRTCSARWSSAAISRATGGAIRPGPGLQRLQARSGGFSLAERAAPLVRTLRVQLNETTSFFIRSAWDVEAIVTESSEQALRYRSPPATRLPMHALAGGKALLAALPRRGARPLFRRERARCASPRRRSPREKALRKRDRRRSAAPASR